MRIGQLAGRTGASVRALRYYEEKGLLVSERTGGGHREYREPDVDRVRFVQLLLAAGLPTRKILDLLPFLGSGIATPEMIAHLDDERARIRVQIDTLTLTHRRLSELRTIAERSMHGGPADECSGEAAALA